MIQELAIINEIQDGPRPTSSIRFIFPVMVL